MLHKLLHASVLLFGISLPLHTKLANLFLISFCVLAILVIIKEPKAIRNPKFLLISTAILFCLALFSLPFSIDFSTSFNHITRRLTYLFAPILLFFLSFKSLESIQKNAFIGFVLGCLIGGTFLLTETIIRFLYENDGQLNFNILNYYYTYHNFTRPLDIHPTYLGSYFLVSIAILCSNIKTKFNKKNILFNGGLLIYLLLITIFINSRIILGLVAITLFLFGSLILKHLYKTNKKALIAFFVGSIICGISALYLIKDTYIFYRFTNELVWEASAKKDSKINKDNGGDSRLARWESIMKVIDVKPILGYGAGNEKQILSEQFAKDNLQFSVDSKYDSHNNYLSYGVQFGYFGIVVLVFYLISNLCIAIRNKDFIYVILSFGLISICFFENYLNNNAGIIFIGFFLNLLLFKNLKNNENRII